MFQTYVMVILRVVLLLVFTYISHIATYFKKCFSQMQEVELEAVASIKVGWYEKPRQEYIGYVNILHPNRLPRAWGVNATTN
mmetsp:Transcript_29641/g.43942  ORF Transcript_29641/g.43942 Transcript_29641/m.43942 type:complete len:82 (+) Transcript_29641:428-673(+)